MVSEKLATCCKKPDHSIMNGCYGDWVYCKNCLAMELIH